MEESRSLAYGINFTSNAEETEAGVRDVVSSLGTLQTEIGSATGSFGRLQNEASEAADSLGDVQDTADDVSDSLNDMQDEAGSLGSAFRKSFLSSVDSGNSFASSLKQGIGGALTYVGDKASDFRENFTKTASNIGSSLAHPIQTIKGSLGNALQNAKNRFIDMARGAEEAEEETEDLGKIADDAEKDIDDLGDSAEKSGGKFEKLGGILKGVGAALLATTTAVTAFAASSVNTGMAFDSSMSQVAATMGYTVEELNTAGSEANETYNELREFAMEMGSSTAFSASQAADALNYMALAGYDADTSMAMLPNVLNLAAAGGIELATASDMVTDAQSALGLSLDETAELVDKMAKASSKSNTSVSQLGEAILTIGGTAKNLAGGTTELSTALGILADNGVKGAEGGTALRNIVLSLSAPTDAAAKSMAKLGLEVFDAEGNMRPLNDTFNDLNGILSTMTQEEQTQVLSDLFNKTDLKSVNALLANSGDRFNELSAAIDGAWLTTDSLSSSLSDVGLDLTSMQDNLKKLGISESDFSDILVDAKGNAEYFADALWEAADTGVSYDDIIGAIGGDLNNLQTAFDNTTGAAQAMADTQLDNLAGDITMFQSALEGAQILVSDELSPTLREFVQFGTNSISTLSSAFKEGGLSGAMTALGTILSDGLGMVIDKLPMMVDAGMQLLGALGQGLLDNLPLIVDAALQIVTTVGTGLLKALPKVAEAAIIIISTLASGIGSSLPTLIPTVVDTVITVVDTLIENMPLLLDAGMQLLSGLTQGIIDAIPILVERLPELIISFVGFITENLPTIIEQGAGLVLNLAMGLINAIPLLVEQLPALITSIVGFVTENLPTIIETGINLVVQLGLGLIQAIPQLVAQLPQIIEAIVGGLADLPGMMLEIGGNLVKGLWEGIQGLAGWIWDQISGWASSIWDGICGFFGIHSPSTEMAWVGEMLVDGLAGSIDKNGDEAVDAALGMADGIVSAFDDVSDVGYNVKPIIEEFNPPDVSAAAIYGAKWEEPQTANTDPAPNNSDSSESDAVISFAPVININVSNEVSEEGIANMSESLRETIRQLYMEFREEELERMALKQQYAF